ncbi:PepSY domain-containing protein [Olivibacter sp. XZL3]|uniref:PepSY domain-containing protein n=1 Tax=Olivibacter sp. XZL3 TaxID=1735116 RepID=UPI0010657B34|nr:PepSY domain-containing protein [Olivibacter sp. XZL3]
MVLTVWRYAHLALAIFSSVFLLILALTGIILAGNAVYEKLPPLKVENFDELNLAQVLPSLQQVYPEIISLSVDHRGFVSIDAIDEDGNTVKAFIDPNTGEQLGEIKPQSAFINWTTALHRSLFLKETGRTIVAVVSFLLILISVSGVALILKRQQGFRHFFAKIQKDFFAQYFHVVTGRWALLPILLISVTGTLLFLLRMHIFQREPEVVILQTATDGSDKAQPVSDFPIFKSTYLKDVEQIDFPFIPDDPEEYYVLKRKDRTLSIHQITGEIIEEAIVPNVKTWEQWNLNMHTGRTNMLLAIVLGLASVNILAFIYSGFAITFKRTRTKARNKFKSEEAEIVILYGSENGSTVFFADKIHRQLIQAGSMSYIAGMDQYQVFPTAKQLIILTSTYGLGDPPSNARKFETLVKQHPQNHPVQYAVVGFGSKAYADYCAFAKKVDQLLSEEEWASRYLSLFLVNDKSTDELLSWIHAYSEKSLLPLATAASVYSEKPMKMHKWKVVEKTEVSEHNATFKVVFDSQSGIGYRSGDLFAIYPANNHSERLYSIGKCNRKMQLIVKLHEGGLGSGYLYNLKVGEVIKARVMPNEHFHFPKKASSVAMVFNGTGIAPFLGMIDENRGKIPVHLYGGFRHDNDWVGTYKAFAEAQISKKKLTDFHFAFSRETDAQYVMHLIERDGVRFASLLKDQGVLMVCGALVMLRDVEICLDKILLQYNGKPLVFYVERGQVLTDCY